MDDVRWAPRVSREQIRRLYESDAAGRLDECLLDEVFFGFLARCRSIVEATNALLGQVRCPHCATTIARQSHERAERLRCPTCSWETTWGAYHATFKSKQLVGGNARDLFQQFIPRAGAAATGRERMLAVDWMIHQVHKTVLAGQDDYHRPAAVNLIEGSASRVAAFLNELAYGPASTPGVVEQRDRWQAEVVPNLRRAFRT